MKAAYPIVMTKGKEHIIVYVPDFNINTEGADYADAMEMARDAIGLVGMDMEDGKVIQFHVLAVQNQFFGAGNHVCQYPLDDTTRIGGVVIGHVLGQFFDVEGFFDYGACIPEAFQWAVFARHLILFVTNHTIKI